MSQRSNFTSVSLISIAVWLGISIIAGLGLVADAVHRDAGANWQHRLLLAASVYMLFAVATPFVYFLVRRRLEYPLRPWPLLALYLLVFLAFFSFYVPASAAIYMTIGGNGATSLTESIGMHSFAYLVIDSFILTALFIACCAIVYYGKVAQQRARFAQLEIEQEQLRNRMLASRARALKAQLEPHFLFNALNAISLLVRKQETDRSLEAILLLSNLLRRVIELNERNFVELGDEIEFSKLYLGLQKLRFGDRIRDQWKAPDAMMREAVPPMLLQPLLENAVRHAVEPVESDVVITISLARQAGRLVLAVCNTLPGHVAGSPGTGAGLAIIRERLQLLYDDDFLFEAGVIDGQYCVRIELGAARRNGTSGS